MLDIRKKIFYFEDESRLLKDYIEVLRENHEVTISAVESIVEEKRDYFFDLLILDVMIHIYSYDDDDIEVKNVNYQDVSWQDTGVEFLRRVKKGEYLNCGFQNSIPVLIATVRVDEEIRDELYQLGINSFLEKPFTIEKLLNEVNNII